MFPFPLSKERFMKLRLTKEKQKELGKMWGGWEDKEGKGGAISDLWCLYCYSWIGAEDLAEVLILL